MVLHARSLELGKGPPGVALLLRGLLVCRAALTTRGEAYPAETDRLTALEAAGASSGSLPAEDWGSPAVFAIRDL